MILPMCYVAVVGAVISMGCGGAELSQTTAPVATATSSAQSDAGVSAAERRKLATCDARRAKPPLVTLPVAVEGTVVAIVVEVSSGQHERRFRDAIKSKVGAPADGQTVAEDVRRLWALGALEDVSVRAEPRQGGIALRFVLRERPAVGMVFFEPAQTKVKEQWPSFGDPSSGPAFDPLALQQAKTKITQAMVADGYRRFVIEVLTHRPSEGVVDLCVRAQMGPRALIDRLEIVGNKTFTDEQLRGTWAPTEGRYNEVGKPYREDVLAIDLLRIAAFYYDRGYLNVRHDEPAITLSSDGTRLSVQISIEEGAQYRIGKLSFKGPRPATYPPVVKSKVGDVFNRSQMMADLRAIEKLHADQGEQVSVVPLTQLFPAKQRVDVELQVTKR